LKGLLLLYKVQLRLKLPNKTHEESVFANPSHTVGCHSPADPPVESPHRCWLPLLSDAAQLESIFKD
jgi:hypothetical protein